MKLHIKFTRFKKAMMVGVMALIPVVCVVMVGISGANTQAAQVGPDEETMRFNSLNNTVFYNKDCISGYSGQICGRTAMEKYWSAFRQYFDEVHVAGIMGNILHEGSCNPVAWEAFVVTNGSGQFSYGYDWNRLYNHCNGCGVGVGSLGITSRLSDYLHFVNEQAPELLKYFQDPVKYGFNWGYNKGYPAEGETYGDQALEAIGDTDFNKLVDVEVKFVMEKSIGPEGFYTQYHMFDMDDFKATTTPNAAARYWAQNYERCAYCDTEGTLSLRGSEAEKVYDEFNGFRCTGGSSSMSSMGSSQRGSSGTESDIASADITLVGDSISVFSERELQEKFPSSFMTKVGSRHPTSPGLCGGDEGGLAVLNKIASGSGSVMDQSGNNCNVLQIDGSSLKDNVVWELGTNTSGATRATIERVIDLVVEDKGKNLFLVTPYNGVLLDYTDGIADLYREIANEHDGVYIVDWNNAVRNAESTYVTRSDSMAVHPTAEGSRLLADLIAEAVAGVEGDCNNVGLNPIVTVNGHEYMFPLAGAAKDNYLNRGNPEGAGDSALSPMPCSDYTEGVCHHNYTALDLGLRKQRVDGQEYTSADFPDLGYSDMFYYSTGVKALAFVDGEITNYRCYANGVPNGYDDQCKCASISYKGDDGNRYWIGHLAFDSEIKEKADAGYKFKLGDVIGEVGPPPCAQGTQAHVHIDIQEGHAKTEVYDIINAAYEALPDTTGGKPNGGNSCPLECEDGDGGNLSSLTDEQAQKIADYYNSPNVDPADLVLGRKDNCVSFSVWFSEFFAGMDGHIIGGNGKEVAHSIVTAYGLPEGNEPMPFSVFSVTRGSTVCSDGYLCGHTGVVVAVDGDTVTVVEAAYGAYAGIVNHYSKSYFVNSLYGNSFVYIDTSIDRAKLASVIGGL